MRCHTARLKRATSSSPTSSLTMAPNNPKTNSVLQNSPTKSRFRKQSASAIGDVSNPFLTTSKPSSRPPSPIKRLNGGLQVTDSLAKQASGGVIRKGGAESRIDVITRDYVPPQKTEMKRSRSAPANRSVGAPLCFITDYHDADI